MEIFLNAKKSQEQTQTNNLSIHLTILPDFSAVCTSQLTETSYGKHLWIRILQKLLTGTKQVLYNLFNNSNMRTDERGFLSWEKKTLLIFVGLFCLFLERGSQKYCRAIA